MIEINASRFFNGGGFCARCNDSHFYADENELFWESRNSIRVTEVRLDQVLKV